MVLSARLYYICRLYASTDCNFVSTGTSGERRSQLDSLRTRRAPAVGVRQGRDDYCTGAVSYVFGGTPEAQVNNGGFNRQEDMDSASESIGEQVAQAVKKALQDVQLNSKVELEVTSQNGLPTLFDYVQKNLDDVASGRPPNYALNANRAGIG